MTNELHRRIVVGVDGSSHSLAAVDLAVTEARLRKAPLHLVAVHPDAEPTSPRTSLPMIMRRVCGAWPGLSVTAQEITGDPAGALIDASRTATLLVVGRRRANGVLPTGAVAARAAAYAHCPTVVVPADAAEIAGAPVLLGLAMTPHDEPAIGAAFEQAALRQVPLLAVNIWSGIPAEAVGTISPFAYDLRSAQHAADQALSAVVEPWADKHPDVVVERMALYDVNPARTMLDASRLANLVVVGAHRYPYRSSQLLGSVTHALLQQAHRPVMVVRPSHVS